MVLVLLGLIYVVKAHVSLESEYEEHNEDHIHHDWNDKDKLLKYPGDIRLAAFFPIHKAGFFKASCGKIQKEDGIQPLEAMLFTLDKINADDKVLPGIKLGSIAVDTCDNPIHATEKSLPMLKGFMNRKVGFEATGSCHRHHAGGHGGRPPHSVAEDHDAEDSWACGDNIVGVIGPQTSAVSLEIASLGRLFDIPLVSYLSTSVTLCQRDKFPNFYRTVPSDKHQAMAIVELMKKFHWNYASFVHSDSEYGVTGYQLVKQAVERTNEICLTDPITIYNRQFQRADYERVVLTLISGQNGTRNDDAGAGGGGKKKLVRPRVVIVFADRVPAGLLLQAAKDLGVKDNLLWIGSDAWASRESVVENREDIVEGALAIQPLRRELPGYNGYFTKLISNSNERNPWFEEYLNVYHKCSNNASVHDMPRCNVSMKSPFKYSENVHFVRDAVYAFAHALHDLHEVSCQSFRPEHRLCPRFKQRVFHDLKYYLSNVTFLDVEGDYKFKFYGHNDSYSHGPAPHDGPSRYSIINFAKTMMDNGRAVYDWKNVGTYMDGDIMSNEEFFETFRPVKQNWTNDCRRTPCATGFIKIPDTDDRCCWHCSPCGPYRYQSSEYECVQCPEGMKSIENDTTCVLIEPVSSLL